METVFLNPASRVKNISASFSSEARAASISSLFINLRRCQMRIHFGNFFRIVTLSVPERNLRDGYTGSVNSQTSAAHLRGTATVFNCRISR
jgi:hypothetical protein